MTIFILAVRCVDALQMSSFDRTRFGFQNHWSRNLLSSSRIIGNENMYAFGGVGPRCISSKTKRMMASPVIQENLNGDAPSTDGDRNLEGGTVKGSQSPTKIKISSRQLPSNWLGEKNYILFTAVLIGLFTGINIAVFKTAVEFVREVLYGDGINLQLISPYLWNSGEDGIRTISIRFSEVLPISVIPAVGGLFVGILLRFGGDMPPGLRDAVREGMTYCQLFNFA